MNKSEKFRRIREEISIVDYASRSGYTIVRKGKYYSLKEHDSVMIDPVKNITETVSDNETAPMTSRYVQKENTLSGESISLAYEFGEQKWLKKVFLKNMTIRANMNDIFRCSTIKAERGTSYPFARTVSFSVNMTF